MKLTKDEFKVLLWDYLAKKLKKDNKSAREIWNWVHRNLK